jgi:hydroxyacylglutathione hydrolase
MRSKQHILNLLAPFVTLGMLSLHVSCSPAERLAVVYQVTGPVETNCYLLYDAQSKEAALIDVGGPIETLVSHIRDNQLELKFIFATHLHMDHIEGVPQIREEFPDARLGYNLEEMEDLKIFREWMESNIPPGELEAMKNDPDYKKWFEYDLSIFGAPDIYLEDSQSFKLGNLEIRTFLSPGHSRGSICFSVEDALFSGDVLFYRQVGRTDLPGGSKQAIVESVRRLYAELPDKTRVYPGHGEFTDIGTEKLQNEEVSAGSIRIKN